jgi:hypothetical protein
MLMLNKEKKMRKLTIALALSLFCAQANAALIGLTQSTPDITSNSETVSYSVATHHLTISGFDSKLNLDGNMITITPITAKVYTIEANLTSTGGFLSGSLVADGNVASVGANTGVLLTGALSQFGFGTAADQQLEFKFTVTGGALAGQYGGLGSTFGVIATSTGFSGNFTADWQNATPGNGNGLTDTFALPEPATMLVLLVGAAAGALRRRNRRRI